MTDQPGDQYTFQLQRQSPVDYVPQRVVSLVPSITESLFDLDLGDRLIARTDYCIRPKNKVQSIPTVGGTQNPKIETIIGLNPDLVLLNVEENRRADIDALVSAGISIWVTDPHTVFDALNILWDIMTVFDHAVMVPRVREIERAYDYTLAAAQPVRVFAPTWRDPWTTFSADTYPHDLLRVCGGDNVFDQCSQISLDELVEAQPEVVLLPTEPYPFSEEDADWFRSLDIPAAHSGRIHHIDGSLLTWHGTRMAYALRDLPPLLVRENNG
jgi:ABC-type Fe3+-hydroxamate transport system substrate-binding protein